LPYPALVGIIVDKKCASTTEQFLLAAKQSKKTVFFGENSGGILDYANMHFLDFPCYDWKLGYATSRTMRLPDMPVDNIGVSPDIRINEREKDWVAFASGYLKQMPSVALASLNYSDTSSVDLKKLAFGIAGNSKTTYDKVRNVVWWTNKNFFWAYTDYQKRTAKQIICRQGGNCNEQAVVIRAILKELAVKTRRTSEINIQPESERRQKDSEKLIAELGKRASVFGYRHNDHVWTEFYDEEKQEWVPADPTLGLIGLESWIKARIGFEPRVNHAVVASADMLVPVAVFALNPDGTIAENRSVYYLIESFNKVYKTPLEQLPSWKQWVEAISLIQQKSREAFEGKVNLHNYTENIRQIKKIYESLKEQYLEQQNKTK
jgi:transglutaminase-like putative cysteine protease